MSPPQPVRILYIDDDQALCRLVEKDLSRHGYEVVCADSGASGLEKLAEGRFDVVALDHHMPEQDGLEVLPQMLNRTDPPPVVYVTGAQDGRLAVTALRAGASDYVIKDVSDDFIPLLRAALDDAVARDRLKRASEAAQRQVEAARDRAEVLLREVNHRVGNSLQLVSSFVSLQQRQISDEAARAALKATQARIDAVAMVHRRLYTDDKVGEVDLAAYLHELVQGLGRSLCSEPGSPHLRLEAEPARVSTDAAVSLGVLATELITNAVKYAYPPGQGGPIRMVLDRDDEGRGRLAVQDEGQGFSGEGPKGTGLGRTIIQAMARNLSTEVHYDLEGTGVRAQLTFDLLD